MATENGVSHYGDSAQFSEEQIQRSLANVPESRRKVIGLSVSKAFNHWCKIPEEKLNIIMKSLDGLYDSATLTENLDERLNKEKEITGGVGIALGSACYLYSKSLHLALQLFHEDANEILCDELMKVHVGYAMETYWKDSQTCPTEEEYRMMAIKKSGMLNMCVRNMQLFSTKQHDFLPLLEDLIVYMEIQDCYSNLLSSVKDEADQGYGDDLSLGKFTFPIIYGIKSKPENNLIKSVLRRRKANIHLRRYCVQYMESIGCFAYTRKVLRDLQTSILRQVAELGGNSELEDLMLSLETEMINI